MKKFHFVVNEHKNGKNIAFASSIGKGENFKNCIDAFPYAEIIHLCGSKKEAEQLAEVWNNAYKANGTYMY